jgi:hypothetical protein
MEPASEPRGHPIDHRAADDGLAHRGIGAPLLPIGEEVVDRDREVMVRRQQADAGVTTPWRSWSVSHANATSKRSFAAISRCIA